MIRIEQLNKSFGRVKVLEDINVEIKKGEFVVFYGPNGCGKSTILRIIAGLEKPTSGKVYLDGEVGFIFQEVALLPWRNVEKNISLGLEIKKIKNKKEIIKKYIKFFSLEGFEKYYPEDLSGGMRQKLVLARTLAVNPDILLMDEPFSNMDNKGKKIMREELVGTWEKIKKTIVFVTHDIEEALFLADKIFLLSNKKPTKIIRRFECLKDKEKIKEEIKRASWA